eukprot:14679961-Alexandrium_andersonii.AAC.1
MCPEGEGHFLRMLPWGFTELRLRKVARFPGRWSRHAVSVMLPSHLARPTHGAGRARMRGQVLARAVAHAVGAEEFGMR